MTSNPSAELIIESRREDIITLEFNDPDHLNAMTEAMGNAFRERVERLAGDDSLRAVVLTGRGRAFSAGGDLDMIVARADESRTPEARDSVKAFMRAFYELFLCVRQLPCPTLAAINGHAIGAGLCVALACDLRYAAREAKMGLNFTKLGLHPGMGASWTLPRLVGPAQAAELLYTSRIIDGSEAERIGLVNRAVPAADTLATTQAVAEEIAACAPFANRELRLGLEQSATSSLAEQLDYESSSQARCFANDDVHEGIAAARERRDPQFRGRSRSD
jgi:enoyl-CoA hydratase